MNTSEISRAERIAREDHAAASSGKRRFATGSRPVIRWIKGDGLDDPVTRTAIAQATRLFGNKVDYCLCTAPGIDAPRARSIMEWASQPVEWWPVTMAENPALATILGAAGCAPENYGYWWKWFPERVRPDGPEWILDGDMVITGKPDWFDAWCDGLDVLRCSQDDKEQPERMYGNYVALAEHALQLYSGLISLPPGLTFMAELSQVLREQPLATPHDGQRHMCEQGVIAVTLARLGAVPIPLHEFPFGRGFQDALDYGLKGDQGRGWGYHFGHAFRRPNKHFEALRAEGRILKLDGVPARSARVAWLGGQHQWGTPGWSMPEPASEFILDRVAEAPGKKVLELGTSRGRFTAALAYAGWDVTTVDWHDRGAALNLHGLGVRIIQQDAITYLRETSDTFDIIVVDLHGNSIASWQERGPLLLRVLNSEARLIISNASLWEIPEWSEETGVGHFLNSLDRGWRFVLHERPVPGVAIVTRNPDGVVPPPQLLP